MLRLDCHYISSDEVERFKEIVVNVIWDGERSLAEQHDFNTFRNPLNYDYLQLLILRINHWVFFFCFHCYRRTKGIEKKNT